MLQERKRRHHFIASWCLYAICAHRRCAMFMFTRNVCFDVNQIMRMNMTRNIVKVQLVK